ncbi:IS3 family transposase [Lactobacillus melliventris]|uniref:IS3 family transposase n=1 Tax=Lactobacillus melliventris TaxID=1218507 RepID=UPI0026879A3A|nr:IS3 family transposase [Lactobacillus melliventris]
MAEIKAIYEEHKHRYGYWRITVELRRRSLLINHKKMQRLMNKLKLFGIVSKRWHKYSSYRGTQGPIKHGLGQASGTERIDLPYRSGLAISKLSVSNVAQKPWH